MSEKENLKKPIRVVQSFCRLHKNCGYKPI